MRMLFSIAMILMPGVAWACPACANREGGGIGTLVVLGVMILFPFLVALVVLPVLKRLNGRAPLEGPGAEQKGNLG